MWEAEGFAEAAGKKLIFVSLDFPRDPEIKAKVPNPERNDELKDKYGIRGFPTVLVMTPDGEVFGKTGYRPGGAEPYIKHLDEMLETGKKDLAVAMSCGLGKWAVPIPGYAPISFDEPEKIEKEPEPVQEPVEAETAQEPVEAETAQEPVEEETAQEPVEAEEAVEEAVAEEVAPEAAEEETPEAPAAAEEEISAQEPAEEEEKEEEASSA